MNKSKLMIIVLSSLLVGVVCVGARVGYNAAVPYTIDYTLRTNPGLHVFIEDVGEPGPSQGDYVAIDIRDNNKRFGVEWTISDQNHCKESNTHGFTQFDSNKPTSEFLWYNIDINSLDGTRTCVR